MEIKFELATEPAVKGTIAVVACVSIAYVSTHADTPYRFASSFLIDEQCGFRGNTPAEVWGFSLIMSGI